MNGCMHAPFKIDPFRSNRHADPMKKEMAGIPGDNAQTRLTESKAGVPGVSNANR